MSEVIVDGRTEKFTANPFPLPPFPSFSPTDGRTDVGGVITAAVKKKKKVISKACSPLPPAPLLPSSAQTMATLCTLTDEYWNYYYYYYSSSETCVPPRFVLPFPKSAPLPSPLLSSLQIVAIANCAEHRDNDKRYIAFDKWAGFCGEAKTSIRIYIYVYIYLFIISV